MPSSLDALLKNLETYFNLSRFCGGEQLQLLLQKGVYPYEYVDSAERYSETELPPREAFYSQFDGVGKTGEECERTLEVWDVFICKTFRDHHNLYNKADVLQLAGMFKSFRGVCMKNCKLGSAWYYAAPGLAWNACLKLTGVSLP